ncbi:hypothetical protein [Cohnella abietis]|uniref:Uncharacterized protein n=1 Tax=Cohnella abietis TaxID=2507935 RepID=A0A3T1D092_9BACL|nr:hypothetical protein [Cohnella abietis]BBI31481.1 hypothetical protein KCTCHS21_08800 [Cohnella abietis]
MKRLSSGWGDEYHGETVIVLEEEVDKKRYKTLKLPKKWILRIEGGEYLRYNIIICGKTTFLI